MAKINVADGLVYQALPLCQPDTTKLYDTNSSRALIRMRSRQGGNGVFRYPPLKSLTDFLESMVRTKIRRR